MDIQPGDSTPKLEDAESEGQTLDPSSGPSRKEKKSNGTSSGLPSLTTQRIYAGHLKHAREWLESYQKKKSPSDPDLEGAYDQLSERSAKAIRMYLLYRSETGASSSTTDSIRSAMVFHFKETFGSTCHLTSWKQMADGTWQGNPVYDENCRLTIKSLRRDKKKQDGTNGTKEEDEQDMSLMKPIKTNGTIMGDVHQGVGVRTPPNVTHNHKPDTALMDSPQSMAMLLPDLSCLMDYIEAQLVIPFLENDHPRWHAQLLFASAFLSTGWFLMERMENVLNLKCGYLTLNRERVDHASVDITYDTLTKPCEVDPSGLRTFYMYEGLTHEERYSWPKPYLSRWQQFLLRQVQSSNPGYHSYLFPAIAQDGSIALGGPQMSSGDLAQIFSRITKESGLESARPGGKYTANCLQLGSAQWRNGTNWSIDKTKWWAGWDNLDIEMIKNYMCQGTHRPEYGHQEGRLPKPFFQSYEAFRPTSACPPTGYNCLQCRQRQQQQAVQYNGQYHQPPPAPYPAVQESHHMAPPTHQMNHPQAGTHPGWNNPQQGNREHQGNPHGMPMMHNTMRASGPHQHVGPVQHHAYAPPNRTN